MALVKRVLWVLPFLFVGGCGQSNDPQQPPDPKPGISSQRSDVETVRAEVVRRDPNGLPSILDSTPIAFEILERAKTKNEVLGVRGWALDNLTQVSSVSPGGGITPDFLTCNANVEKWIIAACDARSDALTEPLSAEYQRAKENALAETKRGEELRRVDAKTALR